MYVFIHYQKPKKREKRKETKNNKDSNIKDIYFLKE